MGSFGMRVISKKIINLLGSIFTWSYEGNLNFAKLNVLQQLKPGQADTFYGANL